MLKSSKSSTLFGTIGLIGGLYWGFSNKKPTSTILTTGAIFGVAGYLLGSAIYNIYD